MAGTNKTVVATLELRVTLPEEAADLMKLVLEDRKSTTLTENIGVWDYDPKETLVSVAIE